MNFRLRETRFASQVRLLQLASQTLPTGAFAYSSGLESLLDLGLLTSERECIDYLCSLLDTVVVHQELPLFVRMFEAVEERNTARLKRLSAYLLASRETREFQQQEQQMARALSRVLVEVHPDRGSAFAAPTTFSEALALAAHFYELDRDEAALLLVYSWVEPQVTALARLIPLGPLAGQRVLDRVLGHVPDALVRALSVRDDEIGASAPALAVASSLHETQYTRIFRS